MSNSFEIEGLRTLYGLVSNPDTKDMKIKSYESLIYGTFLQKNSTIITINDVETYAIENGLTNISSLILQNVINQLYEDGMIKKDEENKIILVNRENLDIFKKQKEDNEKKTIEFYDFMVSKIQNYFSDIFTPTDINKLKYFIDNLGC